MCPNHSPKTSYSLLNKIKLGVPLNWFKVKVNAILSNDFKYVPTRFCNASFSKSLEDSISTLPDAEKGIFLNNLLNVIEQLNKKSVISVQRMCLTCNHYSKIKGIHHCGFLKKDLQNDELQIDCPEHKLPA